jgi:hypothetical protein
VPEWPADPAEEAREREDIYRRSGVRPERAESSPLTFWVDRGTFLIRRIESRTRFETFSTEKVTTYRPEVDVAVSDEELAFDPPTGPSA